MRMYAASGPECEWIPGPPQSTVKMICGRCQRVRRWLFREVYLEGFWSQGWREGMREELRDLRRREGLGMAIWDKGER